jgi:putative tryptophan/tyrosine transport system substrate-binding protein
MMRRREFITLLGGAAAAWPIVARAQQARARPVSAWCRSERVQSIQEGLFRPFLEQMGQLGYVDGQNIIYERRFAEGHDERIGGFIADLARRVVDIIVVTGTRESLAARQGTASIPIVTLVNPDPIGLGLAQSLARPGGNVTGLTSMDSAIYGKRIEILKQAVPDLKKAGMLVSPGKPDNQRGSPWARGVEADARSLGIELDIVQADNDNLDGALAALAANGARGLVVTADGIYQAHRKAVADGAIRHRLPSMFSFRQQAEAGGLLVYAARYADLSRRGAFFVDRIIKGAKPAHLPIEQPTKFELVINLKTAKALGLELPATLLAQADEVIE